MASNGAGICFGTKDRLGMSLMSAIVKAVSATCVYSAASARPAKELICAEPMTMARPFTNPIMHGCGTSRMNFPRRSAPATAWMAPASATAAKRYSGPCDATSGAKTTAVAPAAPEMTPGCAPSTAVHKPMSAAACRPTMGDTPATNVNANDSGTMASETVIPARTCVSTDGPGEVSLCEASGAGMAIAAARSCAALASTRRR